MRLTDLRPALLFRCGAVAATLFGAALARAQDPVRLPTTTIRANPGASIFAGVVRDTRQIGVQGADVTLSKLQKRVMTDDDGRFRLDGVPAGKYVVRVRRLGFVPLEAEIEVAKDGGTAELTLAPLSRYLAPTIVTATAGGLGGAVGDTGYASVADAVVRVLGNDWTARTDSEGRFFMPVPSGSYMVSITKPSFRDRVVSVTIPADSGRHLAIQIEPQLLPIPVREANNLANLSIRLAQRNPRRQPFYTHDDLVRGGFKWVIDAVRAGGMFYYDMECKAVRNGGPSTVELGALTADEVEAVEILGSVASTPPPRIVHSLSRRIGTGQGYANADWAALENRGRKCPVVFVWLR
jgi:hypothetical protein